MMDNYYMSIFVIGFIILICLLFVYWGKQDIEDTYDTDAESTNNEKIIIDEKNTDIKARTDHEKRVEKELHEINKTLSFFKTILIIYLVTIAIIIFTTFSTGIKILDALNHLF